MNKTIYLLLTLTLLLLLLSLLSLAAPSDLPATVHPAVWDVLEEKGSAEILVILAAQADLSGAAALPDKEARGRYVYKKLRSVAEESQRALRAMLDAREVEYQSFFLVNAIKVQADSSLLRSLAARSDVARIVPNPRVQGLSPTESQPLAETVAPQGIEGNITRVHADDVWGLGYTGQGVVVAGQDTGYDWDHAALKNKYRGWNGTTAAHDYNWHDAIHSGGGLCGPNSPVPCDDHSHGTHTMGTIVGDDGQGRQIGVAPGAQWIGCRNMDQGYGTPATYIECFEFFLAPYPVGGTPAEGDPDLAPDVVSNSWGCPPSEGCDPDSLEATVEAVRAAGIVVVVSAGNYGPSCSSVIYPPAIYQQSFTVGGFSHHDDSVYYRSSRGPVTYGGESYRKPDISAPAVSVYSSLPNDSYGRMSGTSMAAPHVAGAVALLLAADPGYKGNADAIEQILTGSARPVTSAQGCGGDGPDDVPNNEWGWGTLDTLAAVQAVTGQVQGVVTNASDGSPIAGARLTPDLAPGREVVADPAGRYTLTLASDTYSLTARAVGYLPQTITDVAVVSGQVTIQDVALAPGLPTYLLLIWQGP